MRKNYINRQKLIRLIQKRMMLQHAYIDELMEMPSLDEIGEDVWHEEISLTEAALTELNLLVDYLEQDLSLSDSE